MIPVRTNAPFSALLHKPLNHPPLPNLDHALVPCCFYLARVSDHDSSVLLVTHVAVRASRHGRLAGSWA